MTISFDRYVGLPWLDRGRTFGGCDCWGLVRLVFLGEAGIELPSYAEAYTDTSDASAVTGLIASERAPWTPLGDRREQPLDLVLMHQAPWHVGIVVRRGLMLHMPEEKFSVIEPFSSGRYGRRLEGIYRHVDLGNTA